MTKYIFVTGGVVSGLGKGITAASLGRLLKARGLKVAAQKLDPYINVDPGTMSPYQHGEVYVTEDGAETDLDLGHYERFIDEDLNKYSNLTTGKVYSNVLAKERRGEYLGKTVQVIPHVTDEIKRFIYSVGKKTDADVVITEIGGTIASGEHKSKPTQHSVKELQGLGVSPNIIILRTDEPITDHTIFDKVAGFCNVWPDCVIENLTLPVLYEAPLMLEKAHLSDIVCRELNLKSHKPDLSDWEHMVERIKTREKTVKIGLIGKYVELHDAYLSVAEALRHAGYYLDSDVIIEWIDSEKITAGNVNDVLGSLDGMIVPGGFGQRGIEGMILSARYARENDIPYFGICLGMQIAVIEFARNVAGIKNAHSGEFARDVEKVIDYLPDQTDSTDKGGTLRLGAYPCVLQDDTKIKSAYGKTNISERHRHRYEFNNEYREVLQEAGLTLSGLSPDNTLVETVEITDRDFYIGVQYHPEFKSRPNKPHPLFSAFIKAALKE